MSEQHDPNLGHNGGPELETGEERGRLLFIKWAWTRAHDEAWKTPPLDILRFRVARAEAAGLTYREYMLQLLDTGRYPQAGAANAPGTAKRPLAKPSPPVHLMKRSAPQLQGLPSLSSAAVSAPSTMAASSVDSGARALPKPQAGPPPALRKVHK
jgi:hypothetical protein